MISGAHAIVFTPAAAEVRDFFRETLGLTSVDAGDGWLIFALPPSELAVHPAGEPGQAIYLMCDDLDAAIADLAARGIAMDRPVAERDWGRITTIALPGGTELALYQPTHPRPAARPTSDAGDLLTVGAAALARGGADRGRTLEALLGPIAAVLDAGSAAVVAPEAPGTGLEIVAAFGLDEAAASGLAAAVRDPGHPIARTFVVPVASFDVLPTRPGGPRLRSHLPLTVVREGANWVLGVLALAHERPSDPSARLIVQAGADLAALALERRAP